MINPRPHKKLTVWQKAMDLVTEIHKMTESFPSNIAEGLTRKTNKDKLHFLNLSQASLSEIDTQIEISLRLAYVD